MKKAVFIVGPTAVGKTALAFEIAEKIPSILISADSAQVFKGTEIITGKDLPPKAQFDQDHYVIGSTPLYLTDVASPEENFSVNEYLDHVRSIVSENISGRLPIVVGGTRFYIRALTDHIETLSTPPDEKLRKRLSEKSVIALQEMLTKVAPEKFNSFNNSDKNNPRRLIRAIEVARTTKKKIALPPFKKDEVLIIGLKLPFENIKKKIDLRIEKRFAQGALDEARNLFKNYDNLSSQVKAINGFNELFEYFKGNATLVEATNKWVISEYQLAGDQLSWLKLNPKIHVFDVEKKGYKDQILRLIKHELSL